MKVVGLNGSPKREGNTAQAMNLVMAELEREGIETEIIHVGNQKIRGCMGCGQCFKNKDEKCVFGDDKVNEWIQAMKDADGIILGSPVHYAGVAGTMKSFLDRAFYVGGANGNMFRHKVGASLAAVRRSGGIPTIEQLNKYLDYAEMVMAKSNYWTVIHGAAPGEVLQDQEGVQIMRLLGKNMAWIMKSLESNQEQAPEAERKVMMNFIR